METTFTNRAIYDKMTSEFIADVKYRLENAYELVKEEDDFRAKLYHNAVDGQFASDCNCCQFCELAKEYEKYGHCLVCDSEKKKYDAWLARLNPDGELEWEENEARCSKYEVHKRYREMNKFDAFDAFLTEDTLNSICEDVLGEILTHL